MDQFAIEPMTKDHLEQVIGVELLSFPVPWSPYLLKSVLDDDTSYFYVILSKDKVIGYGGIRITLDESNLDNIAILPNYRGKGAASSLLTFLINIARNNSCVKLTLEVRESNSAAIILYKKFGFVTVGLRPNYYTKPHENALLMDLTL